MDDEALVGVLTGAGERAFCVGGDLKSLADGEPVAPTSAAEIEAHNRGEADSILGPSRWTDVHSRRSPPSTAPAGAGTSVSPTAAPSGCRGSSVGGGRWS